MASRTSASFRSSALSRTLEDALAEGLAFDILPGPGCVSEFMVESRFTASECIDAKRLIFIRRKSYASFADERIKTDIIRAPRLASAITK